MKLMFKQRMFSWFDSYDVYNEAGTKEYVVKGALSWGHLLRIFDANGKQIGSVKEEVLTWLPKFEMYLGNSFVGHIRKDFSFFKPKYTIDYKGWHVRGNLLEWNYTILDAGENCVATVSKEILNWTDTYVIDVRDPQDAIYALMLVIAIDAEKCSRDD